MNRSAADWLRAILGPVGFGEIRGKGRTAGSDFEPLDTEDACERLIEKAVKRSAVGEIWVGLNSRFRREGGNDSIARSRCLFLDCDTPKSLELVEDFVFKPSWCVKSGSVNPETGFEHRQFGWLLEAEIMRARASGLQSRLLQHLRGDERWNHTGEGLIRIPGTLNWKTPTPRPVVLYYFEPERRYAPQQFEEPLPEPAAEEHKEGASRAEQEEIIVARRREEAPLKALERHLREDRGRGRNDRVYHVFLRRELEAGRTKAQMLAQERHITQIVNQIAPSDHPYNRGKDKGEYARSVKSRIRSGLRRGEVPGLAEILDQAMTIRLTKSEQRVFNVYVEQATRAGSLSISISDRDTAVFSSTTRQTVASARKKLKDLGLLKRTRRSRAGKAPVYRLQLPPSAPSASPQTHALDGQTLSRQEIALQSQFSSSFAFCGLSLRTFSVLLCRDRFTTAQELADLLGIHPKTARRHLARLAQFGLAARFGKSFRAIRANLPDKLRKAAKMLRTAWVCERRERLYRSESSCFRQSRRSLGLNREIQELKAKISAADRRLRPFLRGRIADLHERAVDLLVAPRPPTPLLVTP